VLLIVAVTAIVCIEIELLGVLAIKSTNCVLASELNQARFCRLSVI
jgi:hypothetical protein